MSDTASQSAGLKAAESRLLARAAGGDVAEVPSAEVVAAKGANGQLTTRELFDPVRQALFLHELRKSPVVGRAARAAGVCVGTVYEMRKRSTAFAAQWDEALVQSVDEIDQAIIDRGMNGSDRLLIEAARAYRPEKYSPKIDVDVASRVEIVVDLVPGQFVADTVDAEEVTVLEDE
jgi:hypothetical protein